MRVLSLMMIFALVLVSCAPQEAQTPEPAEQKEDVMEQPERLTTEDGQSIAYSYFEGGTKGAILLHQLSMDRHTYDSFAPKLVESGFAVVSIDVRGHGESSGDWQKFSERDFNNIVLDVKAAKQFLAKQGIDTSQLLIIGASIGANTVINYAAQDSDVRAVIALSPGLNYRGIDSTQGISGVPANTLLVAAEQDSAAADGVSKLAEQNSAVETKVYSGNQHGTNMFGATSLEQDLIEWINTKFK